MDRKSRKAIARRQRIVAPDGKVKRKAIRHVHIPNAPRQVKRGEEPLDPEQWELHLQRRLRLPDRQDIITEYYQHEYLPTPAPPLPRDENLERAPTPDTPLSMTKEADPDAPPMPWKRKRRDQD